MDRQTAAAPNDLEEFNDRGRALRAFALVALAVYLVVLFYLTFSPFGAESS